MSLTRLIMYAVPRFSDGHWPSTVIETFLFPATRAFHLVLLQGWEGVKEIFTRATSARREKPVADRGFSYGRTARRRTIARELTFFAAFDFLVDARTSRIRVQLLPSSHRLLLIAAPTIVWRPGWCCNVDWPFFFSSWCCFLFFFFIFLPESLYLSRESPAHDGRDNMVCTICKHLSLWIFAVSVYECR